MAPAVTGTKMQGDPSQPPSKGKKAASPDLETGLLPAIVPEPLVHGDDTMQAVIAKMRELRSWVENNAENVGERFAEKARKIHYGEEDHRGIFGKATFDEVQRLMDDGIDFLPLPGLPEDNH